MRNVAQLKIAGLYNIPIGNLKKLVPSVFDTEIYMIHYENLQFYLRLGLKLKIIYCVLEFNQSEWLKQYVKFNTHIKIEAEKDGGKDGEALYKLMNNAVYGKTMNLNWWKTCKQQKRLFKMDIQTKLYVTQGIWQWFSGDT